MELRYRFSISAKEPMEFYRCSSDSSEYFGNIAILAILILPNLDMEEFSIYLAVLCF
jgi:hypothetical protein